MKVGVTSEITYDKVDKCGVTSNISTKSDKVIVMKVGVTSKITNSLSPLLQVESNEIILNASDCTDNQITEKVKNNKLNVTDLIPSCKNELKNIGVTSNILSLPSKSSDDAIAISDLPIMNVQANIASKTENETEFDVNINLVEQLDKPPGSAYITVKMCIEQSTKLVLANVCIDTGADITLCDSTYLINHFGINVLKQITPLEKAPKLKSASGHCLKILGKVELKLYLGEYELIVQVIVHESKANIFLLGSDSFYDRLIYDRGRFLAFADGKYPPVPIQYELAKRTVKAINQYQVAPRSSALIQVNIVQNSQFAGKNVLITPLRDADVDYSKRNYFKDDPNVVLKNDTPVRNSVSAIDSQGNAFVLVENDTDDILSILPDIDVAYADIISEDSNVYQVDCQIDDEKLLSIGKEKQWPISALRGELANKLPSNVIVQWDKICGNNITTQKYEDDINKFDINYIQNGQDFKNSNINYVHCKEERKHLLDGTGEGFPTPPSADSIHPDENSDDDPNAWLKNVEHTHLNEGEWLKLKTLLIKNRDAFSKSKTEIGCCNYFKVDLPLKPGTGYLYNKPRPLPFKHRQIAADIISELLAKGVIRPSKSPHATNLVCVKKKTMNGIVSHRVCCDLRQVNEHSIPNRFPNYWIDDAMAKIQGAYFRTALDFKDAFHMLMLNPESIPVTAFYFNNVLFEYVRVPFGHVCAMNAFCSLMALLCIDYEPASYYADDLMITTKTNHELNREQLFEQHLEHIDGMLQRIVDAGLKLVAHKCQWCYDATKPMEWLGFTMENNLLKPQESKIKVMKEFPVPTCQKQVISFISTASFYRRFIKSFAKHVQPMFDVAYKEPFEWTSEAQKAFENVKDIMCSDLILRLPRQGETFQMYTDASAGALGVVLCQIDPIDKKSHPCAYGSRKFNECELKLSIPCKELLAIIYGLNLWNFYIGGNPIQVFSDCRAWTFLKMQSGASGRVSRLALLVSEYDLTVSYVQGTKNKAADGLSRAYDDGLTKYDDQITARHPALEKLEAPKLNDGETLQLNDYLAKCDDYLSEHWPRIIKEYETQQLAEGKDPDTECLKQEMKSGLYNTDLHKITANEAEYVNQVIQEAAILHIDRVNATETNTKHQNNQKYPFQVNDDFICGDTNSMKSDFGYVSDSESEHSTDDENNTTDSSFRAACFNIRLIVVNESCFSLPAFIDLQEKDEFCSKKIELLKQKETRVKESGFFLKRRILMRQMQTRDGQMYNVVCVPKVLTKPLMESTHRSLLCGHFGSQRYILNMSRKYYWPKMKDEILDFHHQCLPCQYNDKFPIKYLSGHVIRPLWPMQVVHCDLVVGLPKALDGSYAILLLYDGFSRFTFGIPLTSEKADYVTKKLMSHFVAAFGVPWALHSDNGRNIDGSFIRH